MRQQGTRLVYRSTSFVQRHGPTRRCDVFQHRETCGSAPQHGKGERCACSPRWRLRIFPFQWRHEAASKRAFLICGWTDLLRRRVHDLKAKKPPPNRSPRYGDWVRCRSGTLPGPTLPDKSVTFKASMP
eukprot:5787984-Pleurochrysis_carterae.AAC.5